MPVAPVAEKPTAPRAAPPVAAAAPARAAALAAVLAAVTGALAVLWTMEASPAMAALAILRAMSASSHSEDPRMRIIIGLMIAGIPEDRMIAATM